VDICICRLDHQSNLLRSAAAREAELFWKSVHRIFPNLPRMSSTAREPTVGNKFGNNHELVKKINSGKTATVYLALDKRTNTPRALKVMPKANMDSFSIVQDLDKEVSILKRLSHPNIVTLLGEAHSTRHLNLLMEFGGHRNMLHLMRSKKNGRLSAEETRSLFVQAVGALTYCHGEHVTHRDLKPENTSLRGSDDHTTYGTLVLQVALCSLGALLGEVAPYRHSGWQRHICFHSHVLSHLKRTSFYREAAEDFPSDRTHRQQTDLAYAREDAWSSLVGVSTAATVTHGLGRRAIASAPCCALSLLQHACRPC